MKFTPHEAGSNANLIESLASLDSSTRKSAGRELFRRGTALADAVVFDWKKDRELAAIISNQATVGIAVTPEHFAAIRAALGNPHLGKVPPDQDAQEFEWDLGDDARLDLLTTRWPGGAGAIARFLAKIGEGIQQIEYIVTDVDHATELLQTRLGVQPVFPKTRTGADNTRVNFFLTATPSGDRVLIELVEIPKKE